jgi:hypothetical protein
MILTELLNNSYEFDKIRVNSDVYIANFVTDNDTRIRFYAGRENYGPYNGGALWEIVFDATKEGVSTFKLTSDFDSFKVLATILKIITDFVSIAKPVDIYFSAQESSRIKLYKKLISRFDKQYKQIQPPDKVLEYVLKHAEPGSQVFLLREK